VNIDFSVRPGFSIYVLFLMLAGIVMVVTAGPMGRNLAKGARILNAVLGVGFFGYGFYLAFMFNGGTYFMFYYVFILPVLLIFRAFSAARASRQPVGSIPSQQPPAGFPTAPGAGYPPVFPPQSPGAQPYPPPSYPPPPPPPPQG
jgi:hypothetical protein